LGDGLAAAFFFLVFFFFFGDEAAGGIVDVRAVADGGMAAKSTPLLAALLAALVVLARALGCDAEVKCSRVRQAVAAGALARPFAAGWWLRLASLQNYFGHFGVRGGALAGSPASHTK